MNISIEHLANVASKHRKLMIGLMSGTSLDGLDIALCEIEASGHATKIKLKEFKTVSYPAEVVQKLKSVVSVETVSMQTMCVLHTWLGNYHADLILEALKEWGIEAGQVDCIASHGQTVYHAPVTYHQQKDMPNVTLQVGDGDHIARKTGILTISDFRQKHTAAGGEGAPMVAITDSLLYTDSNQPRLLLNIGGIANFTYLPAGHTQEKAITTDISPGNTLIDQAMQALFDRSYDEDGKIAAKGKVHAKLLKTLLDDAFFSLPVPRTTGPELFNMNWLRQLQKAAGIKNISDEDLIATLTRFSAEAIADGIKKVCDEKLPAIYVSGGGMYNVQLITWMEQLLGQKIHSFEQIGFNPDAKEAVCFAVLANEMLSGEGFMINPEQPAARCVNFGKISLPV